MTSLTRLFLLALTICTVSCVKREIEDVDPEILGGTAKSGIRFRVNPSGFKYGNELLAPLLSQSIRSIRLPKVEQCIPEVDGCIKVEKIFVSRYECPDEISLRPQSPNEVILNIKNLNLGVTGDLAGTVNTSGTAIPVVGQANCNAHGIDVVVGLTLTRSNKKEHMLKITQCRASVESIDVFVENGGLLGDTANKEEFKSKIAAQLKILAPKKLCDLLPSLIDKDINRNLRQLPSSVSISEIIKMFKDIVLPLLRSKLECPASCSNGTTQRDAEEEKICEECGKISETVQMAKSIGRSLDFKKLNDINFDYSIVYTRASSKDLNVNLKGEFAPPNRITPFRPFNTKFPSDVPPNNRRMAEALLSDFTLNSLFYWLHTVKFLNITLDSSTPTVGEILKTTCGEDDDNSEFPSVEVDEEVPVISRVRRSLDTIERFTRDADEEETKSSGGGLADLGICVGDILPAIREKHPNENLTITVHSTKAPAVIFGEKDGGSAIGRLNAEASIFIVSTGEKVGTVAIDFEVEVNVITNDGNLTGGANVTRLQLRDVDQTLGLPQDALDSLSQLAVDFINKAMNDALAKGINVHFPAAATGLPVSLLKPDITFIDHALHVSGDVEIDSKTLGEIVGKNGVKADKCKVKKEL
ncbi:unnamed protein product [Bursaphelenchus xylophilus]|uniref:(pine wood nematode) hypothetical protein n=1 Tax=Bursaphelenchus xylophilus TaxID=6326 RepID=A0A1I7RVG1_BURXY|nr:unnamed protein product [Bursaphelenchus xylophilus]CAG9086784.1 unnamed protein product [Bursaphelenchus xylophilus]